MRDRAHYQYATTAISSNIFYDRTLDVRAYWVAESEEPHGRTPPSIHDDGHVSLYDRRRVRGLRCVRFLDLDIVARPRACSSKYDSGCRVGRDVWRYCAYPPSVPFSFSSGANYLCVVELKVAIHELQGHADLLLGLVRPGLLRSGASWRVDQDGILCVPSLCLPFFASPPSCVIGLGTNIHELPCPRGTAYSLEAERIGEWVMKGYCAHPLRCLSLFWRSQPLRDRTQRRYSWTTRTHPPLPRGHRTIASVGCQGAHLRRLPPIPLFHVPSPLPFEHPLLNARSCQPPSR